MFPGAPDFYGINFENNSHRGFIYGEYYEKNSFVFAGNLFDDWSVWMHEQL